MALTSSEKYLMEWFERYIKNRDLVFRKIESIEQKDSKLIVKHKNGEVITYHICPFPQDFVTVLNNLDDDKNNLVVYNSEENFNSLIKNWAKLTTCSNLSLFFINPFSNQEKRWVIKPYVHARISEQESVEQGLRTLYEMVDSITKERVKELTDKIMQ